MLKIGIQTGTVENQIGVERAYRYFREAGFEALDWNINDQCGVSDFLKGKRENISVFQKSLPEILEFYKPAIEAARANGLQFTQAHGPFPAWREECPELLDYVIEVTKKCILLCNAVGCRYLVVHGVSAKKEWKTSYEEIRAVNRKLYTSLIPTLLETNVTVCLENLFSRYGREPYAGICCNPQEAVAWIDELNAEAGKECFGLCFDTGHLHMVRGDMRAYLLALGRRVKALHIHDNNGSDDEHEAPYTGTVIWKDLYETLREIGYDGELSFETFRQTDLTRVPEELLPAWLRLIHDTGAFFAEKIRG